jgi:hypothetical protein
MILFGLWCPIDIKGHIYKYLCKGEASENRLVKIYSTDLLQCALSNEPRKEVCVQRTHIKRV